MINYYGKFIRNTSNVLAPLHDLLKKDIKFVWTKACSEAFNKAKENLVSDKVLVHYNLDLPVVLSCDASEFGLGAVLAHRFPDGTEKPINYASRTLTKAEKNYSTIHKEALAVVWGVTKFYQYLKGRQFIIRTDHKPLLLLLGEGKQIPKMASGRVHRWAFFLSGFNYKIEYIKGADNTIADSLSRLPDKANENGVNSDYCENSDVINWVENFLPVSFLQIRSETRSDPVLQEVIRYLKGNWPTQISEHLKPFHRRRNELAFNDNVLFWGHRTIIPKSLTDLLLKELHSTHLGIIKM